MPYTTASVARAMHATASARLPRDEPVSRDDEPVPGDDAAPRGGPVELTSIVNLFIIVNMGGQQGQRPTQQMGDHLRTTRERLHLSTQSAAAQADISPGYLFKLESGYVGTPSPRVLYRLSQVLEINYWQLMNLAGYVVPEDYAIPAITATADPTDPLERIAAALEEIRDEIKGIRRFLRTNDTQHSLTTEA